VSADGQGDEFAATGGDGGKSRKERTAILWRLRGFVLPVADLAATLLLKPGALIASVGIGSAVALFSFAFWYAGLDKNLLKVNGRACHRCTGYLHGTVAYAVAILLVAGSSSAPTKGMGNPALPWVLYAIGGVLVFSMAYHGYQHRVRGVPRHVRTSWLTGFSVAFFAVSALSLGLLLQF
jgi:hypothetical protein